MKRFLFLFLPLLTAPSFFAQHIFHVDFSEPKGKLKDLIEVNKGRMNYLGEGYQNAGISLVRMHDYHGANDYCFYTDFWNFDESLGEFTTRNENFDPDDPAHYDWEEFDALLRDYYNLNLEPYVRFGASYPNPNYTLEPMRPPFDSDGINFSKFATLCKRTVMHINGGWDDGTFYDVKYWEFWNEPGGLFWDGSPGDFYRAYEQTATAIKSEFPEVKIGAPGALPTTTIGIKPAYGIEFLNFLQNNNLPLDFYSWHFYGLMNPYALFGISENIRLWLDERGFTEAESHVTEINHMLEEEDFDYFDTNAKGTAYFASLIITAQKSTIDKLFWYPGKSFFEDDGITLSWVGLGAKAFGLMKRNAPEQIFSNGDIVIEDFEQSDTTNVMLLASKSLDGEKVYLFLSNYNSNLENFTISVENLPWEVSDSILCTRNITKNPESLFEETTEYITGNSALTITIENLPPPSTALIRLEKKESATSVSSRDGVPTEFELKQNYPNPFSKNSTGAATTTIEYSVPRETTGAQKTGESQQVILKVFNLLGEEIAALVDRRQLPGNYKVEFNAQNLSGGIYLYKLQIGNFVEAKKMILIR